MTTTKDLGIWMDHTSANLMEFTADPIETKTIYSKFTHEEKEQTLGKSENLMHNKEQHEQADYYRELGEIIRNYDDVVLFGPTDAKVELYNTLKDDHLFAKIEIEVIQADKMTENQQHAFVRKHFSKH
jgi:nitrogenase subunit NifH